MDENYWTNRYVAGDAAWDKGSISTPIKEYIDQLNDKNIKILIPGCGYGHEGIYLWDLGFRDVHFLDFSKVPLDSIHDRRPEIPKENLRAEDFFSLDEQFDLILEQTLFCAIDPIKRAAYAEQAAQILKPGGKLVGLFFDREFDENPPFGGSKEEYLTYFNPLFSETKMGPCFNSIESRAGSELFAVLKK